MFLFTHKHFESNLLDMGTPWAHPWLATLLARPFPSGIQFIIKDFSAPPGVCDSPSAGMTLLIALR